MTQELTAEQAARLCALMDEAYGALPHGGLVKIAPTLPGRVTAPKSRRSRALKTHCIRGHEMSGWNVRIRPDGRRACRKCNNQLTREYRQRQLGDTARPRTRLTLSEEAIKSAIVPFRTPKRVEPSGLPFERRPFDPEAARMAAIANL